MDFAANKNKQIEKQLQRIGLSFEELIQAIPKSLQKTAPLLDDGLSEMEGFEAIKKLGAKNTITDYKCYLGAGAYEHYIPAIVSAITSKSEFLTSYTPYQAESSQGYLQAIFEYQTAMANLTDMEVANASAYDGASALAEAVIMAIRIKPERKKVVFSKGINPLYMAVVDQYLQAVQYEKVIADEIEKEINEDTIAIVVQSPNYLGIVEDLEKIKAIKGEAIFIVSSNPLSFGIYKTPGELGADIAVGDTQPFGIPLQFGGPYAGYIATLMKHVRQLPGRIIGETVDTEGKRGFILALQTREQHIRREKATSNICTNQALMALSSLVSILWYGKNGIKELALSNYKRAMYLKTGLENLGFKTYEKPIFNEFWVGINKIDPFLEAKIVPGHAYNDGLIVAVTETKTQEDLDHYLKVARSLK